MYAEFLRLSEKNLVDCLQDMLTTYDKALISVAQSSTALKPEILALELAAMDSAKSAEKRRGLC